MTLADLLIVGLFAVGVVGVLALVAWLAHSAYVPSPSSGNDYVLDRAVRNLARCTPMRRPDHLRLDASTWRWLCALSDSNDPAADVTARLRAHGITKISVR